MVSVFERDAEFIQLLCNPEYIRWLYSMNYFTDPKFIDYLKYLRYFRQPEYIKYLVYPQAVVILDFLLEEDITAKLENDTFCASLGQNQYYMWKHRDK